MKLKLLAATVAGMIIFTGCGSNNPQPQQQCSIDGAQAPEWICNDAANFKDGVYAVGSAQKTPLGYSFQKEEATAVARDAIARKISLKVKNMLKRYYSSTGVKDSQTSERVVTSVSKQLAKETLQGSKIIQSWTSPKGTLFVLVGVSNEDLKKSLKNSLSTYKNKSALWQELKAQKAQEELEKQIDKEFGN